MKRRKIISKQYKSVEDQIFFSAPEKNKKRALKYILLLMMTRGLKGNALKAYLWNWNLTANEARVSYSSLIHARKVFEAEGKLGLLKPYGRKKGVKICF